MTLNAKALQVIVDKSFMQRILSALLIVTIVLGSIYLGQGAFLTLTLAIAVLMGFEWSDITKNKWKGLGLIYILMPTYALTSLISQVQGAVIVTWLFITIWISDTAAFFIGSIVGGPKLLPSVSPKKTWAGLVGALLGTLLWGVVFSVYLGNNYSKQLITLTVITAILAQIGDLFESLIKRKCGVKDSSKMIPGHGGILDRMDGLTFAAPVAAIVLKLFGNDLFL